MIAIEELVSRQERIMKSVTFVGVDRTAAEHRVGSRTDTAPVTGRCSGEIAGQRLVERVRQGLSLMRDIIVRMRTQLLQLGRGLVRGRGEREDTAPSLRGGRLFFKSLVELGEVNERRQKPLVYRKGAFERHALGFRLPERSAGRCEIQPKFRRVGISAASLLEMIGRGL